MNPWVRGLWAGMPALCAVAGEALACGGCAPLVRAHLFERGDFLVTLAVVLAPVVAVALVASLLHGAPSSAQPKAER